MFTTLKLKTVTALLVLMLGLMAGILIYGMWSIQNQLLHVDDLWHQYQVDRSDKFRLQSNLRKAIGYGGMIHNFKNYVLRQQPLLLAELHKNFGAAHATLTQYDEISNPTEHVAIQDVRSIIEQYQQALILAHSLANRQTSPEEIDKQVMINDTPALLALKSLTDEIHTQQNSQLQLAVIPEHRIKSKAHLIANLRTSMGYGGIIHKYKNYILHHDPELLKKIKINFEAVWLTIKEYQLHDLTAAEKPALDDISQTVRRYQENINRIQEMIALNKSAREIDAIVKIDDTDALHGFLTLEKQISIDTVNSANDVNATLHMVNLSVQNLVIIILILIVSMVFLSLWLMLKQIIKPIQRLTSIMTELANDQLDIETKGMGENNEIAIMTKVVNMFKENAIRRKIAEDNLEKTNLELNKQIQKIEKLRLNAQEQANNAMSLAENLSDARITAEQAQSQAEFEHNKIQIILDTVKDGIISANQDALITSFNPAAELIFGYSAREIIGKNISTLMPAHMREAHQQYFNMFLNGSSKRAPSMTVEQIGQHKSGKQFPIEISLNSMYIDGKLNFTTVIRDITERKMAEEKIKKLAMHDPLTGLANRNQFQQRLSEAIHMADRHQDKFVLLMMDLDKFKPVNDLHGHLVGDAVLEQVASRLNSVFRAIDTVTRYGGDEFATIVTALQQKEDALPSIKRVLESMGDAILINGKSIDIGISIGISVYPDDAQDAESLISYADKALYKAKAQPGNHYNFYTPS